MRVLFIISECSLNDSGDSRIFAREYVKELRKYADVLCVFVNYENDEKFDFDESADYVIHVKRKFDASSDEAIALEEAGYLRWKIESIIENFRPDVIHCNNSETYLPFRFDENVFYSSHLIESDAQNQSVKFENFFLKAKLERHALKSSCVTAVYSDFAANRVNKLTGGINFPIVLPFGVRFENFLKNEREKEMLSQKKKISVSYFASFNHLKNGLNDFIYAVNKLGKDFKEKNNIEYSVYGRGKICSFQDMNLIDNVENLEVEKRYTFYKSSDIVVISSVYETFCFAGLEAMASGALVLLPSGLGMDMYAKHGYNCLEIPMLANGISEVLCDAVENLDKYKIIRDNAKRTAKVWSWKRCVDAHLFIYRQMIKRRYFQLSKAYSLEERKMIEKFNKSSDAEKVYIAEIERKTIQSVLEKINLYRYKKILVLTGVYVPESEEKSNIQYLSVLNEEKYGFTVRPECLSFSDREYDLVLVCGAWDTVIDPCSALTELERICKKELLILYNQSHPYDWQTFYIEDKDDFERLSGEKWRCINSQKIDSFDGGKLGKIEFVYEGDEEGKNEVIA